MEQHNHQRQKITKTRKKRGDLHCPLVVGLTQGENLKNRGGKTREKEIQLLQQGSCRGFRKKRPKGQSSKVQRDLVEYPCINRKGQKVKKRRHLH